MALNNIDYNLSNVVSHSYWEARNGFLDAALSISCEVESFENKENSGPNNEKLFCDVAGIGNKKSKKKMIVSSGAHGIEGYCGSAMQTLLMSSLIKDVDLKDVQIILVHALNPYGFAHGIRNNEDNIDLNRNFIDFESMAASTEDLQEFRDSVYPDVWSNSDLNAVESRVDQYISDFGEKKFQTMMTQGQYSWPFDPYYGGASESWSNKTWHEICDRHFDEADTILHLDLHTGLGPSGACEIIYTGRPDDQKISQTRKIFSSSNVVAPGMQGSVSPAISGALANGLLSSSPESICIALEFGTVPTMQMLKSVIAANWLYNNSNSSNEVSASIKTRVRDAFFVNDESWLEQVWAHTHRHAVEGLKSFAV